MPPRSVPNPAPKTESAREARKSFFCELCSKGYSRMNEYEAHESSYDHQHKKRLKEMKAMQRDPLAVQKARKAERKADEKSGLISIKPVKIDLLPTTSHPSSTAGSGSSGIGGSGGFKKGGFRNAFAGVGVGGANKDKTQDKDDETDKGGGTDGDGKGREGEGENAGVKIGKVETDAKMEMEMQRQKNAASDDDDASDEERGYELYDPRHPTDCWNGCAGRRVRA